MRLAIGPTYNRTHRSQVPAGRIWRGVNASADRAVAEARPGCAMLWRRSGQNAADVAYGYGFGRWNGVEEWLIFIKPNGSSAVTVYSVNAVTGVTTTYAVPAWNDRSPSEWTVTQFQGYLYASNPVDGLWQKAIGDTTATAWRRVPTILESLSRSDGTVTLERPNPHYNPLYEWGSGALAGTAANATSHTAAVSGGVIEMQRTIVDTALKSWLIPITFELSAAWDVREQRYLFLDLWLESDLATPWDPAQSSMLPYFKLTEPVRVYIHDSAGATVPNVATDATFPGLGYKQGRCYVVLEERSPEAGAAAAGKWTRIGVAIDLDHTQTRDVAPIMIAGIRKFSLLVPFYAGSVHTLNVGSPYVGGVFLNKPDYTAYMDGGDARTVETVAHYGARLKDIEYAICSFDGGNESAATFARLSNIDAVGRPILPGSLPLGARARVRYPVPAGGFTGIRIFRKRIDDGGRWYCIHQTSAGTAGEIIDARVDALQDAAPWNEVGAIRAAGYDFGSQTFDLLPSHVATWKGSLALAVGGESYLSRFEDPSHYVLPQRLAPRGSGVDTDDVAAGATGYMADDLSDSVLCQVAQDILYAAGRNGIYATVGDSAAGSTPFRKIPGSVGALGSRAMCGFRGGVIVAGAKALWFYRVSRAWALSSETDSERDELTADVPDSYADLLRLGGSAPVVVGVREDEIWVMRGRALLRRTRYGSWEFGVWASGALSTGSNGDNSTYGTASDWPNALPADRSTVSVLGSLPLCGIDLATVVSSPWVAAMHADSTYGLTMLSSSGVLLRIGENAAGNVYRSDAGYAIPWAAAFGTLQSKERSRAEDVQVRTETADVGGYALRVLCESYDGGGGNFVSYAVITDTAKVRNPKFASKSGWEHTISVGARSALHSVTGIWIDATGTGPGGSN